MINFSLRPTRDSDKEQIIKIWTSAFGDSEDFARALVENFSIVKNGVCAEHEGKARSFMFAFDGLSFCGEKASYLYGLCTEQKFRGNGLGSSVSAYAVAQARDRGAQWVFLRPADSALEKWYSSILSARSFAPTKSFTFIPSLPAACKAVEISPEEYFKRRGNSPWFVPEEMIRAEGLVHKHFGGAFLRCGDCLVCAELCGSDLYLREIIGDDVPLAISATAEKFRKDRVYIPLPSDEGIPLMCIPPLPSENLSSMPLMPFTFD